LTVSGVKQSIILREEHRLRVFENRVLRGISVYKRKKVTDLAQNGDRWRALNTAMKPRGSIKCGNILSVSFSRTLLHGIS
jgi:hypothetical protein